MHSLALKAQAAALYAPSKSFQQKGGSDANRSDLQQ
jgi:hypothetical protein